LVTGSTRRIGRAIATRCAAEARRRADRRTETTGHAVQEEIRSAGGDATYVRADLAREATSERAVDTAVQSYGGLTTLVNNAAPDRPRRARARRPIARRDHRRRVGRDHDRGAQAARVVHATRGTASRRRPDGASIVNISSAASMRGVPGSTRTPPPRAR
jgi:NAD(P)-dependent dehydrogenase (short-subunit alcohol dehydrogenase family)